VFIGVSEGEWHNSTLHHSSFSMVSSSALTPRIAQPGAVKKGQKQASLEVEEDL